MLYLYVGDNSDYKLSGDGWFDNWIDENVLMHDFSKRVVRGLDKSEVISPYLVQSPILGAIPPRQISGGSKTLITIMYSDAYKFSITAIGDNCFPYLREICDVKDVHMCISSFRRLFALGGFEEIGIENDGSIVYNDLDLLDKVVDLRNEG